ncbi:Uncharacterized protein SCF082_LOCUS52192 [Durusdinium trenchii]|uniref:Uncharacterized protein n=1 Tax=Durusdinium trenchii TaxID=1381693 RepID=A0ABP0SJU2_9DINO
MRKHHNVATTRGTCSRTGLGACQRDSSDWGRLWTATADGSIVPEGKNPFPVELVSKRMGFEELDVTLFCDMTHALRQPPIKAQTNESTGLHVHIGRYPGFFSVEEVGAILKVYLRFEPAINKLLLPVTRQRNRFCRDFREVLGRAQGLGECASDEQLFSVIDSAVAAIKGMSPEIRAACINGCRITTTKEALMLALLGEAGLWRLKRPILTSDANGQQLLLPAGMALKELFSTDGRRLWRPPTSQELQALWGKDGEGGPKAGSSAEESLADPPTPWTALEALDDQARLQCIFQKPDEIPAASVDHWLLRDALILERHGTRYCKLNIMRIAQSSDRATIEFRQFPGGDFNQPLLIWGWVKFLGLLVTHACACVDGVTDLPSEGSEEELKRFLRLRSDSLLLAWFRDVRNRLPKPEIALQKMKDRWERLWHQWAHEAEQIESKFEPRFSQLLCTCKAWRRIFQAASGMKAVFAPSDPVWNQLTQRRASCERFMQELYKAIASRLKHHIKLLVSAEEISRTCSLDTVVEAVLKDGRLRQSNAEIRDLQAAVTETLGWEACPSSLTSIVSDLGKRGADLTLDYASNLLLQLERSSAWPPNTTRTTIDDAAARGSLEDGRLERWKAEPEQAERLPRLWRTYHELCVWLLLPRVDEVVHLWAGLARRGWEPERVRRLWPRISGFGDAAVREIVSSWFARHRAKRSVIRLDVSRVRESAHQSPAYSSKTWTE